MRDSMKELWHKMDGLYDLYAKSLSLNFITILVMELLYDCPENYTQKALCEKLGIPKQLVNSIIKSFWEQGFVRLKEAKDRRNKEIIVTAKGKAYILKVLKPLEDAEAAAWGSFSANEAKAFVKSAEQYIEAFESALKIKTGGMGNE